MNLPVTLQFNESWGTYAWLELTKEFDDLKSPQEYFISPAVMWNKDIKKFEIIGYSFVHVSTLPNQDQLFAKLYQASGDEGYKK